MVTLLLIFGLSTLGFAGAVWTSKANGNWNSAGTWTKVSGTSTSTFPVSGDDVTIGHSVTITVPANCNNLTINAAGKITFVAGQSLVTRGNVTCSGTIVTPGVSTIYFNSTATVPNAVFTITGTLTGNFSMRFRPAGFTYNISANSTFTAYQFQCEGLTTGGTLVNNGNVTVANLFTISGGSTLRNAGTITTKVNITNTASTLDASVNPNTFNYTGSGWNTVLSATYHHLNLSNNGTAASKTLGGNLTFNGTFTIGSDVNLNCNGMNVTCNGTWKNNNPTTNISGTTGTFTFGGANPTILRKTNSERFGNVVVSCTGSFILNSSNTAGYTGSFRCGNLTLASGSIDLNSAGNYTVSLIGNLTSTGGTVIGRNGYFAFGNIAAQTIGGNTMTFSNISCSNPAGVSTTSAQNLTGTLLVNSGSFTSNTGDFTLISDATTGITARVGTLGGSVAGSKWVVQRRILTTGSSSSTPYWDDFSSPVTAANLSDWDNEMYMSGVGGNDGTACCPTFYSVQQWNNGGGNYSSVTSLIGLTPGYGYSIWTATNTNALNPFTFDTKGTPNQGTIVVNTPASDYYLLGNPYPSQILFSSLTRSNVNNSFYCLDETLKDFATWDGATSIGTGKLNGSGGVINSSQGFMVQSTGGGNVTFTEASKSNSNVTFVREVAPENLVKFHFSADNKQVGMQNVLHFVAGADNRRDGLDMGYPKAPFLKNRYIVKTLTMEGVELCKNTLDLNSEKHEIPVVFAPAQAGNFTFNLDELSNLKGYTCIVLEDQQNGMFTDLTGTNTYNFDCSDNSERHFVLHFSKGKENTSCMKRSTVFNTINANLGIASNVFVAENGVTLSLTNNEAQRTQVSVYNVTGELISSREENMAGEYTFEKPIEKGIYFVVLTRNGKTETHKVVIY